MNKIQGHVCGIRCISGSNKSTKKKKMQISTLFGLDQKSY